MKKRVTAVLLVLCLMTGFISTIIPVASATSVTTDDMASLASAARQAIGSSAVDLGLPAGDWCGYFVGNRMNNSQIAAKLGMTPYNVCAYAISLVSWICATKDMGVFYVASPAHQNRLLEIDPRLGDSGRMVARASSGWSPLPGDILQFSWSNWSLHTFDHTGIIVSINGDMITYVDGNGPSGRVAAHTIRKDSPTIIGHIRFNTDSTPQSAPSAPAPSVPTVSSIEQGDWGVWIPANCYLPLDTKADSVTHISSVYARPASYRIVCSERATLSNGTVRYKGVLNVPGSGSADFWFTYTDTMTVEDYTQPAHTEHTWDAGVETVSPTLTTPGMRTYTCSVCGETKTDSIEHYTNVSGICGDNVRWRIDDQGTLTISGSGKVVYQPWPWDEYPKTENRDTVKRIVVEEGITELSVGALFHLPNAVSVELPQSLTSISGDVFWQCYSLKDVTIPAQVSYLHPQAFRECTSLTNIKVDGANPFLRSYDGAVFSKDMRSLICFPNGRSGSFCVPEGVTYVGDRVFSWCLSLKELQLPQSVSYIGSNVFPGQDKVSSDAPKKTDLTLAVSRGSYAERYAIENDMSHRLVNVSTPVEPDRVQVTLNLGTIKSNHLDRFKTVKVYRDGTFRDVDSNAWYAENVSAAYELGLMEGTSGSTFAPQEQLTVGQAVTLSARLRSICYADGAAFKSYSADAWYIPYVDYMKDNGLLSENYDYDQPATREEFVHILAQALPDEALMPILPSVPDFIDAGSIHYKSDVDQLSRARVITGSGGSFFPQNTITRAEAAAVVTRMAKPELRKG